VTTLDAVKARWTKPQVTNGTRLDRDGSKPQLKQHFAWLRGGVDSRQLHQKRRRHTRRGAGRQATEHGLEHVRINYAVVDDDSPVFGLASDSTLLELIGLHTASTALASPQVACTVSWSASDPRAMRHGGVPARHRVSIPVAIEVDFPP
jgi:hypothetical protein